MSEHTALDIALEYLAAERAHADRGAQAAQAILYIVRRHCPESPEEDALRDWLDAHDAAREAGR